MPSQALPGTRGLRAFTTHQYLCVALNTILQLSKLFPPIDKLANKNDKCPQSEKKLDLFNQQICKISDRLLTLNKPIQKISYCLFIS